MDTLDSTTIQNGLELLEKTDWQKLEIFGLMLLKAILIIIIGYALARLIRSRSYKIIARKDKILASFISQMLFVLCLVVMIIAAFGTIGVQTNSIIAVLGTAGVAIALGLKDSLSSVASGIALIILRPFKQGDLIEINGMQGSVESIQLFTTNLRLNDGKVAIIPNSTMSSATIINTTLNEQRRIEFILGVSYETNIEHFKATIVRVLESIPEVDSTQNHFIGLNEFAPSSMDFNIRFWVRLEYGILNVKSKVLESIKTALDKEGIEIPYNKLDITLLPKIELANSQDCEISESRQNFKAQASQDRKSVV